MQVDFDVQRNTFVAFFLKLEQSFSGRIVIWVLCKDSLIDINRFINQPLLNVNLCESRGRDRLTGICINNLFTGQRQLRISVIQI